MASIAPSTPTTPSYFPAFGIASNVRTGRNRRKILFRAFPARKNVSDGILAQNQSGFTAELFHKSTTAQIRMGKTKRAQQPAGAAPVMSASSSISFCSRAMLTCTGFISASGSRPCNKCSARAAFRLRAIATMLEGVAFCSTLINAPFTHATNQLSWESPNSYTARVGQIVKWIAAPADRVIQAILFPLFILMIQGQRIASSTTYRKFICNILVTPISLAIGLLGSALFLAAGIIQCFFPL